MIVTELYNGQGLGNQLLCYVVTRLIAERNNYEFGIMGLEKFKGRDFMALDFGNKVVGGSGPEGGPPSKLPDTIRNYYKEKQTFHPDTRLDITKQDLEMLNVKDHTKIDGIMQSINYIKDHKAKISSWLQISKKSLKMSDDLCVIHIRGGDFNHSLAMLGASYYSSAIKHMLSMNKDMKFVIVTDDPGTATRILPNIPIVGSSVTNLQDEFKASHHIGGPVGIDYEILNTCKNVIMSASSFGFWPVWTNGNNPNVIAPKYWAAHKQSDGYWSCGESRVDEWKFLDREGSLT